MISGAYYNHNHNHTQNHDHDQDYNYMYVCVCNCMLIIMYYIKYGLLKDIPIWTPKELVLQKELLYSMIRGA